MRNVLLALALLVGSVSVHAQAINNVPEPEKQKTVKAKAPKFKFVKQVHDFGTIPEGPSVTYIFEFKNVGNAPLVIEDASASCGCTTPEWTKEPVLPGKKGKVTVTYNTAGRGNQPFDKQIFVTSNVPTEKVIPTELHIKGFVSAGSSIPADNKVRK
ncbi:MAG TPA: DUF1573 domain-containing protein [Flavipsychrobacter sp.]|nr:DUF1573 domain-containing protein [Flavipsychrobacter sp.]